MLTNFSHLLALLTPSPSGPAKGYADYLPAVRKTGHGLDELFSRPFKVITSVGVTAWAGWVGVGAMTVFRSEPDK